MASNAENYNLIGASMLEGNWAALADILHPDMVAYTVSAENSPLAGTKHGAEAFIDYIKLSHETSSYSMWEALDFFEDGDTLVVLGRERFRIHDTGREMETAFAHVTKWVDGKLIMWRDVFDSASHRDVWTKSKDFPAPDLPNNIARYKELMRCFSAHDIEGVMSLVDAGVVSENRAPYNSGISANRHGIKEFMHYISTSESTATYDFLTSHDWLESGDKVVALGRERFTIKSTGMHMETPFVHESHWKDGKLIFWREYYDTARLEDVWIPYKPEAEFT